MEASIRVVRGGPLVVEGRVPLTRLSKQDRGPERRPAWVRSPPLEVPEPYAVCRCGRTTTPPLCDREPDGSCFDEPAAMTAEPLPVQWKIEGDDGPGVALKTNGPARMTGGVPIAGADGRRYPIVDRCSLCRCGTSGAMPFCDGSHKVAGFRERDPAET